MATALLDSLANDLIEIGIMTNYEQILRGVWKVDIDGSRLLNRNEIPQEIRYGSANNLAYCPKGEQFVEIVEENLGFVTIEPFVSLDGKIHVPYNFCSCSYQQCNGPHVAVEKIKNLIISGYQREIVF